jgi:hypothetical protein
MLASAMTAAAAVAHDAAGAVKLPAGLLSTVSSAAKAAYDLWVLVRKQLPVEIASWDKCAALSCPAAARLVGAACASIERLTAPEPAPSCEPARHQRVHA